MRNVGDAFARAFVNAAGWSAGWRVGGMVVDGVICVMSGAVKSGENILPPLPSSSISSRLQVPPHIMQSNYDEVSLVYDLPVPADGR